MQAELGIAGKIRSFRPAYVIAFDAEGEKLHRVNAIDSRQRVHRMMETLAPLAWNKIEAYDKKDGLLFEHKRSVHDEAAPGALEELAGMSTTDRGVSSLASLVSVFAARDAQLLTALTTAQRLVIAESRDSAKPLTDAMLRLVDVAMNRLGLHEKQYEHAIALNHDMTIDLAAARAQITATNVIAEATASGEDDDELTSEGAFRDFLHAIGVGRRRPAPDAPPSSPPSNPAREATPRPEPAAEPAAAPAPAPSSRPRDKTRDRWQGRNKNGANGRPPARG